MLVRRLRLLRQALRRLRAQIALEAQGRICRASPTIASGRGRSTGRLQTRPPFESTDQTNRVTFCGIFCYIRGKCSRAHWTNHDLDQLCTTLSGHTMDFRLNTYTITVVIFRYKSGRTYLYFPVKMMVQEELYHTDPTRRTACMCWCVRKSRVIHLIPPPQA